MKITTDDMSDIEIKRLNKKIENIDKVVKRYLKMKRNRMIKKSINWIVKLK
jgi:hypothetical protein